MSDVFDGLLDRFRLASAGFERHLRTVRPAQWEAPTPCSEWNVRQLVNHMTRGNLNYVRMADGVPHEEFMRLRDVDTLGDDPLAAYAESVRACANAFSGADVLDRELDYPLGRITGRQALAVRTADSTIHTWDLARAIGVDEALDPELVAWLDDHRDEIFKGLSVDPGPEREKRFFAQPDGAADPAASRQHRLLHWMGRRP